MNYGKVCTQCGYQADSEVKYCPQCGSSNFRDAYRDAPERPGDGPTPPVRESAPTEGYFYKSQTPPYRSSEGYTPLGYGQSGQSPAPARQPQQYGTNSQAQTGSPPRYAGDGQYRQYGAAAPAPAQYNGAPSQPQYGNSATGQPQYGNSVTGQQQYGNSVTGQQQYGGSAPGQSQYGGSAPGQAQYGNSVSGQQQYGNVSSGQSQYGAGAPAQPQYGSGVPGQAPYGVTQPMYTRGMKWYKFIIYFMLFAGAVLNLVNGILLMTGGAYYFQSDGEITSEMVYFVFGGLQSADIIFGLLSIGLAAFQIFTRFALAKYKKTGPLCLYAVYASVFFLNLLRAIIATSVTGISFFDAALISSLIAAAVMVVVNVIYFNKRKDLFTK